MRRLSVSEVVPDSNQWGERKIEATGLLLRQHGDLMRNIKFAVKVEVLYLRPQ